MDVSGQVHALADLPSVKEPPVPIGYEAGWAPQPVCTHWTKAKSLPPSSCPAHALDTTPTTLKLTSQCSVYETHKYTLWAKCHCLMLKQMIHKITTALKW